MITKLYSKVSSEIALNIPYSLVVLLSSALYKIIFFATMLHILHNEVYDF
jgi:hypothetical protein